MTTENTSAEKIAALVKAQKDFYAGGATRSLKFRRSMLLKLGDALKKWEKPICDALWEDLHKSYKEAFMTEIGIVHGEIGEAARNLSRWARRRRRPTPLTGMPSSGFIVREPLGCTLIVSPWNYPVQLLLNPLVGAIAAGCTAVLKPSPYVPSVSLAIARMIADTFPEEYIAVVQGDRTVNAALFAARWDMVFYTGSPATAKVLAAAQAGYLTPMVLELGGKSPCIVDRDADTALAARRIVWGKCLNAGQTCIAPDYLFLHEDIRDEFIAEFKKQLAALYPEGTADSNLYVRIVRDAAFRRITSYLKDGTVLAGGHSDPATRWIEPTLLGDVSPDSPVMTEEIFGPVLPVLTFRDRGEVAAFVNSREKPLAFYYFGKKPHGWDIIGRTSSGGACINDTIMHFTNGNLPFGGVGNSGMGSYHGERSFLAFSHERAVITTPTWIDLPFRYMPYKSFRLVKKMLLAAFLTAGTFANAQQPAQPAIPSRSVSVMDYGGTADGVTPNTAAFEKAVAALSGKGGGHLVVPEGIYLTGPIVLGSGIDLHLERGAVILLSPDKRDFLKGGKVVPGISASGRHDVSISGEGTIDGNGAYWRPVKRGKVSDTEWKAFLKMGGTVSEDGKLWYPFGLKHFPDIAADPAAQEKMRTHLVRFTGCERVCVSGVTLQNAPKFHLVPSHCTDVTIDGVTVRCPWNAQNGDGIDIMQCSNVYVARCTVDVGDDGICLKGGAGQKSLAAGPCRNILIEYNTVLRAHGGFVIGSEFSAGMEDITVRHNTFLGTDTGLRFKSAPGRGGVTRNIRISDINMAGISGEAVVFETSYADRPAGHEGNRAAQTQDFIPEFTDILIERVVCRGCGTAIRAEGTPATVHGVTIRNSTFFYNEKGLDVSAPGMVSPENVSLKTFEM